MARGGKTKGSKGRDKGLSARSVRTERDASEDEDASSSGDERAFTFFLVLGRWGGQMRGGSARAPITHHPCRSGDRLASVCVRVGWGARARRGRPRGAGAAHPRARSTLTQPGPSLSTPPSLHPGVRGQDPKAGMMPSSSSDSEDDVPRQAPTAGLMPPSDSEDEGEGGGGGGAAEAGKGKEPADGDGPPAGGGAPQLTRKEQKALAADMERLALVRERR